MQLWYQGMCYPAICIPPFTTHCVRASSGSVWFRCFFSRSRHVAVLARRGCDCSATARDLWLPLVLTPVACFEFLLSTMLCRRSSEIVLPACWRLMAHGKCLLSLLVFLFKMCQTKVRMIILSLSLKANFWITDENNIACIPHMPVHPAI